jgi:hypothetical protein
VKVFEMAEIQEQHSIKREKSKKFILLLLALSLSLGIVFIGGFLISFVDFFKESLKENVVFGSTNFENFRDTNTILIVLYLGKNSHFVSMITNQVISLFAAKGRRVIYTIVSKDGCLSNKGNIKGAYNLTKKECDEQIRNNYSILFREGKERIELKDKSIVIQASNFKNMDAMTGYVMKQIFPDYKDVLRNVYSVGKEKIRKPVSVNSQNVQSLVTLSANPRSDQIILDRNQASKFLFLVELQQFSLHQVVQCLHLNLLRLHIALLQSSSVSQHPCEQVV